MRNGRYGLILLGAIVLDTFAIKVSVNTYLDDTRVEAVKAVPLTEAGGESGAKRKKEEEGSYKASIEVLNAEGFPAPLSRKPSVGSPIKLALSMDGGGIRGLMQAKWLTYFEESFNQEVRLLRENPYHEWVKIYQIFDHISGTSIGGILAMAYATKRGGVHPTTQKPYESPSKARDIEDYFMSKIKEVFTTREKPKKVAPPRLEGEEETEEIAERGIFLTFINNLSRKIEKDWNELKDSIGIGSYKVMSKIDGIRKWCRSIFFARDNPQGLEKVLRDYFGSKTLNDPQTDILVTSANRIQNMPSFYRHVYSEPYRSEDNVYLRDVGRATSAAPTYFPPAKVTNITGEELGEYIDGGMVCNNPAPYGLTALIQQHDNDQTPISRHNVFMLSLGTGNLIDQQGVCPGGKLDFNFELNGSINPARWTADLNPQLIIDSIMSMSSEAAHMEMNRHLGEDLYKRINPVLRKGQEIALDEATDENIELLIRKADEIKKEVEDIAKKIAVFWIKSEKSKSFS